MKLADLPSAIHPPNEHKASKAWRRQQRRTTRREFIRLAITAALGTGLAFVSLMPTARRAKATHETPATIWSGCYGPNTSNRVLTPGTGCCSCGSQVSTAFCGSDDWHEHHSEHLGSGYGYFYALRDESCGRGRDRHNAWLWTVNNPNNPSVHGQWRCSDGLFRVCTPSNGCPSWTPTVCPIKIS